MSIFINFNSNLKSQFINKTLNQFGIVQKNNLDNKKNFFDSIWGHYLTAIEIFKNYPLFEVELKHLELNVQKKNMIK